MGCIYWVGGEDEEVEETLPMQGFLRPKAREMVPISRGARPFAAKPAPALRQSATTFQDEFRELVVEIEIERELESHDTERER